MKKPNNYDSVQPYQEHRKLPAGGYVCEIKKAEEMTSSGGRPMVKLAFDIAEGEYKGYFMNEYRNRKAPGKDVKWPFEGTKYQLTEDMEGNADRTFKGLCTAIEAENVTILWDGRFCNSIQGALVGVVFREEETEWNGFVYDRTVPLFFCTCEDVRTGNYRTPRKKTLEKVSDLAWTKDVAPAPSGFQQVEEEIPF